MSKDSYLSNQITTQPRWEEVSQQEIDNEFIHAKHKGIKHLWLVTCRYQDGYPTCTTATELPYSDSTRREYLWNEQLNQFERQF